MMPTVTGSDISTPNQQDLKLRAPAREWIDSVYPDLAPFAGVGANDPVNWQVNQADHAAGDSTITIDGGSGDPAVGDIFRVVGDYQWDADRTNVAPDVDDSQPYRITAYAANVITHEPTAAIDFVDNAPVNIGTPGLIRQAAALYAVHRGFILWRDNPLDKEAAEVLKMARNLLQIPEDAFLARARPESASDASLYTSRVVSA